MKKKISHSVILWLASLVIVLFFVYYIYSNIEKYAEALQLSARGMLSIFLISLLFPVISGLQNTMVYRKLGTNVSYWDGLIITASSTLANQLPISGGIITKGIFLKKKFGLPYTLFASSIVALFICYISASGFIGLMVLAYWLITGKVDVPLPLMTGYLVMTFSFMFFLLSTKYIHIPRAFRARLKQAIDGWEILGKNPVLLARLIGLQTLLMILLAVRYWFAFHMLSQDITIGQSLLFSTASILTQLVSIAPGGLGVRELIVGTVAGILGFDISIGILAVGLDRLVSTLVVFLAGWMSVLFIEK